MIMSNMSCITLCLLVICSKCVHPNEWILYMHFNCICIYASYFVIICIISSSSSCNVYLFIHLSVCFSLVYYNDSHLDV